MGSTPSPPPAPDPAVQQKIAADSAAATAKIQAQNNLDALRQSQAASMIGQSSPVGSISYKQTGTDAYGNPLYTMNSAFTPEQQQLYDETVGIKNSFGQQGQSLAASSAPMYSDANTMMSNLYGGADSLTGMRLQAAMNYQNPFNTQDKSWLDTQLRNQGLMPGDPGYDSQMNRLQGQQSLNEQNLISQMMPESLSEAQTAYMMPLNTASQLNSIATPTALTQLNSPTFTATPADYAGAVATSLNAQNQNYGNQIAGYNAQVGANSAMMSGMFGIGSSALKLFA